MELLSCALRDQQIAFMDVLDLVFKWISLRLCEKENVKAMGQAREIYSGKLGRISPQLRQHDVAFCFIAGSAFWPLYCAHLTVDSFKQY